MIDVQITIKGENAQNSFYKKYYYPNESDEEIFFNSVQLVTARIEKKLKINLCLLYTSPSPRDLSTSRMPSSA